MPLSIGKLEKLLSSKGFLPKKYFAMHGLCVYVEVLNITDADSFMLYIPSKYEIKIHDSKNVYKINYLDISEDGTIPEDYAGDPDNLDLEKQYDGIDMDFDIDSYKDKDIEVSLEENYNHPLSLKDIGKNDKNNLREIFRQLRRLKFCVQSLKYKLCIVYKQFICCIRRDDTFEGFVSPSARGTPERRLMVTLDLETLYDKIDSMNVDIKTIKEGVYRVLDKNQHKHIRNLEKMLDQKNNLSLFSNNAKTKKEKYTRYLEQLEQLLSNLNTTEKKIVEKILQIQEKYNNETSLKGLHTDIEKSHQIAKYESELSNINSVKQELITNILVIKSKHEDLSLKLDKICFDNTVMIDAIVKNFIDLSEL